MQSLKNRVVRVSDETWDAAKVAAEKDGTTVSAVVRRLLSAYVKAAGAALVLVATLTACGGAEPVAQTTVEQTEAVPEVAASVPVVTPTAVIQVGIDQILRIDGRIVGRVNVRSYDPADDGVAVEVNSAVPMVVDPADFTLTDASGATIVGVTSTPLWDRDLAANDQTMGQVIFAGAVAPVSITYTPEGAEPLFWSFA